MIKAVKVLNLFSTILFGGVLLLVYAYLPISVSLHVDEITSIHKQQFFTYGLIGFVVINGLLRLIVRIGLKHLKASLFAWCSLLIFVVNVYLAVLIGFVGVWNNSTHIRPESYAYLNFIGPILFLSWIVGLIFLFLKRR